MAIRSTKLLRIILAAAFVAACAQDEPEGLAALSLDRALAAYDEILEAMSPLADNGAISQAALQQAHDATERLAAARKEWLAAAPEDRIRVRQNQLGRITELEARVAEAKASLEAAASENPKLRALSERIAAVDDFRSEPPDASEAANTPSAAKDKI